MLGNGASEWRMHDAPRHLWVGETDQNPRWRFNFKQAAKRYAEDPSNRSDPHAYSRMLAHLRNGVEVLGGKNGVDTWLQGRANAR